MKYLSLTLVAVFFVICSSTYAQTRTKYGRFEISINGGIPSEYDYGQGVSFKYIAYPIDADSSFYFGPNYHATFSIGLSRFWDYYPTFVPMIFLFHREGMIVVPVRAGFKIGKEKQYFSWEIGWASLKCDIEKRNTLSFAIEGVLINIKRINIGLIYQGYAGKLSPSQGFTSYYSGYGSVQLAYKIGTTQ